MSAQSTSGRSAPEALLIAFDLETTGSSPEKDQIIEIGAVKRGASGEEMFQTFVDPGRPIPPFIRKLTGIGDKDVKGAPTVKSALKAFSEFVGDATLVAHNAAFDRSFLLAKGFHPKGPIIDSLFLSHLALPLLESHGLASHAKRKEVEFNHHRARDDAAFTLTVTEELLEMLKDVDPGIAALAARLAARGGDDDLAFLSSRLPPVGPSSVWAGPKASPRPPSPGKFPEVSFADLIERMALERRPGQERMAEVAFSALDGGGAAVLEAGTGTGKSLAYLWAALRASSGGGRVVVSTHTHNLQTQLLKKDVPEIEALMGPMGAVAMQGQGNYLCLLRWEEERERVASQGDSPHRKDHLRLLYWLRETESGEGEEIGLPGEVWGRVNVQRETCLKERCPHFEPCFFYQKRRQAEKSRLIIVNHALLVADALTGGSTLPESELLVVDEAHQLEPVAMEMVGPEIYEPTVRRDLEESRLVGAADAPLLVERSLFQLEALARGIEAEIGIRRTSRLGEGGHAISPVLEDAARGLALSLTDLIAGVQKALEGVPADSGPWARLNGLSQRLRGFKEAVEAVFFGELDVRWVETGRYPGQVRFRGSPLYAGDTLRTALFEKKRGVVLTSATLAIGEDFSHTLSRLGLDDMPDVSAEVIQSPFFFHDQALLCAVDDLPDPREEGFDRQATTFLKEILPIPQGGSLVLFTAHSQLKAFADQLRPHLKNQGITLMAQGIDGSRAVLVERMRKEPRTVIFGAQSFWEGVDIVGPALSLVVVVKLPFWPPDHPVRAARAEAMETEGRSSFEEMSLPEAVLRFKQGFGRLIRSTRDQGAVVVLDRRIVKSRYGPAFLEALPGPNFWSGPRDEAPDMVRKWV